MQLTEQQIKALRYAASLIDLERFFENESRHIPDDGLRPHEREIADEAGRIIADMLASAQTKAEQC